jgi:hypothetical protein
MYSRSSHEDFEALGRTSLDCASLQSINVMGLIDKFVVNITNRAMKNSCDDWALKFNSGDQLITIAFKSF